MMGYEEVWYALLSFAVPFSFIIVSGLCLCGCRKQSQKNDLLGLAGMVKITNPDENVNNVTVLGTVSAKDALTEDESARLKVTANPHRSLPDIPIYSDGSADGATVEQNLSEIVTSDMISELYATVGDQAQRDLQNSQRLRNTNNSSSNRSSVNQHGVDNQGDDITSPYATVRNPDHTYNRVHVSEHPYAQLQASRLENAVDNVNAGPSNSRRNSTELLQGYSDDIDGSTSTVDIPAAPAIAGRVSANQELPYMTPPIQTNAHFSGDSQDSSKGYTSISVREPLVNILAQVDQSTVRRPNRTDLMDSHYATVSDDSDEMYAAIDEPFVQSDVYTSVSETYAQIQPPVENAVEINQNTAAPPNSSEISQLSQINPVVSKDIETSNTSVSGLQHLTPVHSRQDSSSSCVSSVGNLGSPKPEKRQANSPLPPPPSSPINFMLCKPSIANSDLNKLNDNTSASARNSIVDLHNVRPGSEFLKLINNNVLPTEHNVRQLSLSDLESLNEAEADAMKATALSLLLKDGSKLTGSVKDLEEMYAKVVKKNKNLSNFIDDKVLHKKNDAEQRSSVKSGRSGGEIGEDICNEFYESDSDITSDVSLDFYKSKKSIENNIKGTTDSIENAVGNLKPNTEKDPGYETIHDKRNTSYKDPGYETIDKRDKTISEKCNMIPDVPQRKFNTANYSVKSDNQSLLNLSSEMLIDDSCYESNQNATNASSDSDPNYEVLRSPEDYSSSSVDQFTQDLHSKHNRLDKTYGYSTISELVSNNNEPTRDIAGYSVVNKNKVQNPDSSCSEHNYESLSQYYTTNSECDPNYESVEQLNVQSEPPYTRLHDESPNNRADENCPDSKNNTISNLLSTSKSSNKSRTDEVDDYFQV